MARSIFSTTILISAIAVTPAPGAESQRERLNTEGEHVYQRYCVGCHGARGDGDGLGARLLVVKPRDFTKGIFKFRSTSTGTLPTDEDLYRTITRGIYGTSMPSFGLLSEQERLAVVQYIKSFYPEWQKRGAGAPVLIPNPPPSFGTPQSIRRGKELYDLLDCKACHGESGRGDGVSGTSLDPDAWGNPQRPFDFTSGQLRGGPTVKDVYRTFMTGINGTAMPSYEDIFAEVDDEYIFDGDAWNLVSYIVSLRRTERQSAIRFEMTSAEK